jgi:Cellulase N-terminal ig-like domain
MRQLPSYLLFIPALLTSLPCWAASPLKVGPNGPIPWIVVDQFGYPATAAKVAVIRNPQTGYDSGDPFTPGTAYAVVSKSTGQIVMTGPLTAWNGGATDSVSGDKAWWFDFSSVTQPGTYLIEDVQRVYNQANSKSATRFTGMSSRLP